MPAREAPSPGLISFHSMTPPSPTRGEGKKAPLFRPLHRRLVVGVPGFTQVMRGIDQRDVGQGLREIAGLASRAGIELFRQQPEIVGDADDAIEQRLRLVE